MFRDGADLSSGAHRVSKRPKRIVIGRQYRRADADFGGRRLSVAFLSLALWAAVWLAIKLL